MSVDIWVAGALAGHRRARTFRDLLGARIAGGELPEAGLCIVFGNDYQRADVDRERWLGWALEPGRTLLLVPPLEVGISDRPASWSVSGRSGPCSAPAGSLAATVAPEVRHQLSGALQVPGRPDGRWDDGTVHTAFHRRHPHSGIFAATCLPLWSAALLAHRSTIAAWVLELHELSGRPAPRPGASEPEFRPTPDHFALLLHLLQGNFTDRERAMRGLATSRLFELPAERAAACHAELERTGYVSGGTLTGAGLALIQDSPYRIYAEAIEEARA